MEPSKFDELTKALATSTSRRQALKAIAATALGGLTWSGRHRHRFCQLQAQWDRL